MPWYLKACPECHADLHDDAESPGWVTCFMCARSFNGRDVQAVQDQQQAERDAAAPLTAVTRAA